MERIVGDTGVDRSVWCWNLMFARRNITKMCLNMAVEGNSMVVEALVFESDVSKMIYQEDVFEDDCGRKSHRPVYKKSMTGSFHFTVLTKQRLLNRYEYHVSM